MFLSSDQRKAYLLPKDHDINWAILPKKEIAFRKKKENNFDASILD
jgi:hypothetical protein